MSKKKSKRGNTMVALLFDETGSMGYRKAESLAGVSEYITGLQADPKGITFTQVFFNSINPFKIINDDEEIKNVVPPTASTYKPEAMTPLYDALGNTIIHMDQKLQAKPDGTKIIVVTMTDGEENDSSEFDQARISKLIKKKTKKGWAFVFLGADIDSFAMGKKLGVSARTTANYAKENTTDATRTLANATLAYASGKSTSKSLLEDTDGSGIWRDDNTGVWRDTKGRFSSAPRGA